MKRSDFQKSSRRNEKVKKHLNGFRQSFEKVSELLLQSQDYIAELEKELQQTKLENKSLSSEVRKLKGDAARRRSGSEDVGNLFRTRSMDDSFRRTSPTSGKMRSMKDFLKGKKKFSSKAVHQQRASDSLDDDDDDVYAVDESDLTPRSPPVRRTSSSTSSSVTTTPNKHSSHHDGDSSGDEGGGAVSAGTAAQIPNRATSSNDIVKNLSHRIFADPEVRNSSGFQSELVVPPMEDSPFYRELVIAFGTSVYDVAKYLKKLSKCANSFAADAHRLMDSWKELGYVLRNSIGSKHIDKRQSYFFQNQDKMFNAHALLGNLFEDSGRKLEKFFNDVQTHFVMPIEAFVANDSKECKLLKRRLDEREDKYMKHLRKYLDNKVKHSHRQKAEMSESSNLKNKREYEIARFQYIYRLNIISARKDIDVLTGVGAAGRAFVKLGLVEHSKSAQELMERITAMESTLEAKRHALAKDAQLWLEKKKLLQTELSKGTVSTSSHSGSSGGGSAHNDKAHKTRHRVDLCTPSSLKGLKVYADPPILPGVEQQGYLYKKGHNVVTPWQRRWFYIADGKLWYYRDHEPTFKTAGSGKDAIKGGGTKASGTKGSSLKSAGNKSDSTPTAAAIKVCDIMLCTVRECEEDKDFQLSFEIIAPGSRSYVLQAESTEELKQWMSAIRRCIEEELVNGVLRDESPRRRIRLPSGDADDDLLSDEDGSQRRRRSRSRSSGSQGGIAPEIAEIIEINSTCADCRAPDPDWASINLGVVVCIACSGVHRSMGSHISQVRSLTLDRDVWTAPLVGVLRGLGNVRTRQIFERTAKDSDMGLRSVATSDLKSSSASSLVGTDDEEEEHVEQWIRAKYEDHKFVGEPPTEYDPNEALLKAAAENNLVEILRTLNFKADIDAVDDRGRTAAIIAASHGFDAAVALLYYNGANLKVYDSSGNNAYDAATTDEVRKFVASKLPTSPAHNSI